MKYDGKLWAQRRTKRRQRYLHILRTYNRINKRISRRFLCLLKKDLIYAYVNGKSRL